MSNDKLAVRIGALLAKAEHASTEEEAAAYFGKAQALSTQHQIELETARLAHTGRQAPAVPTVREIVLGEPRQRGLYTYVQLFSQIGRANGVKSDVAHNSTRVWAYGFAEDIDTVEQLYNSLVVQMTQASRAYIAKGEFRNETSSRDAWDWKGTRTSALTARLSFQQAFAQRIGARLREAKEQAITAKDTQVYNDGLVGAALVLAGRDLAVQNHYRETSNASGRYRGGRNARQSLHAAASGYVAGDKARLGAAKSIGGARTAISA